MPLTENVAGGAFERVSIMYAMDGGAVISWELRRDFKDPAPYSFQLQVNRNWEETSGWVNVGTPVADSTLIVDTWSKTDATKRQYGKFLRIGYRVVLTTVRGSYTSPTAQSFGNLSMRQWLLARAIMRRVKLKHPRLATYQGYLLKRKIHGERCSNCYDPVTRGCTNTDCTICMGTGVIAGYWKASSMIMFDMTPEGEGATETDQGTVDNAVAYGTFIGIPPINRYDVWLDSNSDARYYIGKIQTLSELNGVPLVVRAEMRLAEFSDVIYKIPKE